MPMDLQALMMPVSDDEQMKALAQSLRGRQTAADFFSASSIPNLQRMAQSEQEYIQNVGNRQGVLREALERRKQDQAQHEALLEQRKTEHTENVALREAIAAMRGGGASGYAEPRTQKERAAFASGGSDLETFEGLADTFQDSYSATVPLMGGVENFFHRNIARFTPLSDDIKNEGKDQALWWSDYKEYAELVRRHGLFGSALTKNESAEWAKATITPNDDPAIVKAKLATQRQMIRNKAEKAAAQAMLKGYDPEQIRLNFGAAVELDDLAARLSSGEYSPSEAAAPSMMSEETDMDLSGLSDEELRAIVDGN